MSANLRQKLGRALLQNSSSGMSVRAKASQGAVVNYTQQNNELTNKWLHRLRLTASTNEARDRLGQLSTVLEYLNKQSTNTGLKPIEWKEWEDNLHTAGVVDRIKGKYEAFMKAEYSVESAVSQVGVVTEKMQ